METPTQLDMYSIMDVLSDREKISQPTESDLTPTERAFIADSKIAEDKYNSPTTPFPYIYFW
jgi:hypothetical protein